MSENAYESPVALPEGRRSSRLFVLPPATILLILTMATLLFDSTIAYTIVVDSLRFLDHYGVVEGSIRIAPTILAFGVVFVAHWVVFGGTIAMCRLRRYRLARVAAIVSLVPVLTPGYVIGIPLGIWALIALQRVDVRHAFFKE